jgi:hypothetical protein
MNHYNSKAMNANAAGVIVVICNSMVSFGQKTGENPRSQQMPKQTLSLKVAWRAGAMVRKGEV